MNNLPLPFLFGVTLFLGFVAFLSGNILNTTTSPIIYVTTNQTNTTYIPMASNTFNSQACKFENTLRDLWLIDDAISWFSNSIGCLFDYVGWLFSLASMQTEVGWFSIIVGACIIGIILIAIYILVEIAKAIPIPFT